MTAQELLQPRFELIADYPESNYEVGYIFTRINENRVKYYEQYPHLFRKLKWWEKRNVEDMPLKIGYYNLTGVLHIMKIIKWDVELGIGYESYNPNIICNLTMWEDELAYFPLD